VMANVSLGHSIESLMEIGESFSSAQCVRVFAGYAGWSSGQLDDEMRRGSWLSHPASIDLIFHVKPDDVWHRILREKGWKYRLVSQAPDDLSWN
jgi:putative transcriptional regulator